MRRKIDWLWAFTGALALWLMFGSIPYLLYLSGVIEISEIEKISPFGGMFGPAEAFFSGFALIAVIVSIHQQKQALDMQKKELEESRVEMKKSAEAQANIAAHQKNAISLQVIIPFMTEISSEEMRQSIITLSSFARKHGSKLANEYKKMRDKYHTNQISKDELESFEKVDSARRKFIGIFHKMQRLKQTDVVDDKIVKAVIGPDHALLLISVIEPMEAEIRKNYSTAVFNFIRELYSQEELQEQGAHKQASA